MHAAQLRACLPHVGIRRSRRRRRRRLASAGGRGLRDSAILGHANPKHEFDHGGGMRRRSSIVLACGFALSLISTGQAEYDDDDHPSSGSERDDDDARGACHAPHGVSSEALRRAILRMENLRSCETTDALSAIVDDATRDAVTRAMAALALGEIACRVDGRRRREVAGLSAVAVASLENATSFEEPAAVRESAARALGRARATSSTATLDALRTDDSAVVRYIAAQSLTRITGQDQFDTAFRDRIITDIVAGVGGTYSIVDERTP